MPKIVIDCQNPEEVTSLEEQIDSILAQVKSCSVTYFNYFEALKEKAEESGKTLSEREASRIIASGTGEKPDNVRIKIQRGRQVAHRVPPPKNEPPPIGKFLLALSREVYSLNNKLESVLKVSSDIQKNSLAPLKEALTELSVNIKAIFSIGKGKSHGKEVVC